MRGDERWAERLSTWFGCGYVPVAPGTAGAVAAVPLHWLLRRTSPLTHAAVVVVLTAVGVWASQREAARLKDEDPTSVVIDEVVGTLMAMGLVRTHSQATQFVALVLFRVLDIVKPGPIDDLQHTKPEGVGIMLDDVLAGLTAGLTLRWLLGRR